MFDDLRHGLAAYLHRPGAPECAVCGRPIVDQDDLAFTDREHANLHEACAIDIPAEDVQRECETCATSLVNARLAAGNVWFSQH